MVRESASGSKENREDDLITKLLHAIKGEGKKTIVKKYPIPTRNSHYSINSGEERTIQEIFTQVKTKLPKIDSNFDVIEKLMIEIFRILHMNEFMNEEELEPITVDMLETN